MSRLPFILYQVLLAILALAALPYMLLRRSHEIAERLGGGTPPPAAPIWIHAASLGEFEAAAPILAALRSEDSTPALVLSCTNWVARSRLRERLPDAIDVRLAPLDLFPILAPMLSRARLRSLIFVETEIWPAWIWAASRQEAPIAIVNGRISDRSLASYRRLRTLLAPFLRRIAVVGCRTEEDRRRWIAIGAPAERCEVWGNTKYAAGPPPSPRTARRAKEGLIWTIGSLRRGEEAVLDAIASSPTGPVRVLLAPRHLREAPYWEVEAVRRGLRVRRLSEMGIDPFAPAEILLPALRGVRRDGVDLLLVDRLGILRRLYWTADFSFVGGTLAPFGGHNLFEPAREGSPVFFGPSVGGVRDAADALLASGGGVQIASAEDLAKAVGALAGDGQRMIDMRARARAAAESLAGGAERSVRGLRAAGILPAGSP